MRARISQGLSDVMTVAVEAEAAGDYATVRLCSKQARAIAEQWRAEGRLQEAEAAESFAVGVAASIPEAPDTPTTGMAKAREAHGGELALLKAQQEEAQRAYEALCRQEPTQQTSEPSTETSGAETVPQEASDTVPVESGTAEDQPSHEAWFSAEKVKQMMHANMNSILSSAEQQQTFCGAVALSKRCVRAMRGRHRHGAPLWPQHMEASNNCEGLGSNTRVLFGGRRFRLLWPWDSFPPSKFPRYSRCSVRVQGENFIYKPSWPFHCSFHCLFRHRSIVLAAHQPW